MRKELLLIALIVSLVVSLTPLADQAQCSVEAFFVSPEKDGVIESRVIEAIENTENSIAKIASAYLAEFDRIWESLSKKSSPDDVCDCSENIYNCSDFDTHKEAQACFEHCESLGYGDIHRLDRDDDGEACESLD